jgi:hypothetical protein
MNQIALIGGWAVLTVTGLGVLLNYKQTPGEAAVASPSYPAGSAIERTTDRSTLVMIVHPRCPCSRASISELSRLMTRVGSRLTAHVLVVVPDGAGEEWEKSDLAESAAAIPGVDVRIDRNGSEGKLFGAITSGQTYLYSPKGELQFSGGLTPSRGHQGDNFGSSEIERLTLSGDNGTEAGHSNVFGCELHDAKK